MLRGEAAVGPYRTQYVRLEDADSQDLAELPGVVAITPYTLPELRDERSSADPGCQSQWVRPAVWAPAT